MNSRRDPSTTNGRRNPLDGLDPAVNSVLTDAARRQRIRQLPKDEQARARREAARERVMLDIPKEIQEAIAEIAQREGMTISGVVTLLLADGILRYRRSPGFNHRLKRPSRSPRVDWAIAGNAVASILSGKMPLTDEDEASGGAEGRVRWLNGVP
jgi:hypothetical protein